jgi:hypothetical protein
VFDPSGSMPGCPYRRSYNAAVTPVEPLLHAHEGPVGVSVNDPSDQRVGDEGAEEYRHRDIHPQLAPVYDEDCGAQSCQKDDCGESVQQVVPQTFRTKHCAESPVGLEQ